MSKHLARIAVTALFFIFGGISASWASRIPTIKEAFGVNDSAWGFVLLYISIGTLITLPIAGRIIEKLGSKKATLLFLLTYLVLLVGIGYWEVLWQLKVNLVLFGAISNITNISINTQAIKVSKLYKGQIIGSLHGTWSIGGFAASWLGAEMISSYVPPLEHFIYYSTIGIIISLLLFKYLIPETNDTTNDNPILAEKRGFQLPDKNLVLLGLLAFFAMVAEGMMTDWSSEYMKHVTHAPIQLIGYGLTAYMFAMASGRFISDFTVRRFGEQRTLLFCGILLFIGLGASVLFPGVYTTIISFMIVGLGVSAVVPMCYNLAGHTKTMPPQQALTLITSIGFIGFFLGPPVIGFIAQHSSLKTAFAIVAFFGLAISLLSRFIVIESTSSK
ncbi:MFS transporter [Myroides odoratimimus]|uniref:MFS transporter n=1 Tax=Myroides odoratimimus TaxID=76832 RepID=UPI0009204D12|nr:MFS transporter [Myroides odoratimimus]MCO7723152.1 MFS transporter [Myroides odoratimimus]MDM1036145.1 MFS transporter [Myroides odoratimimus]MDM1039327.1 MFS transporter [Myroides odoratimimus]MDM1053550.1 MFS transporter [Myroides odoratimimus]MDM1461717.1 MFS transporter [Myroides odoratimimus]